MSLKVKYSKEVAWERLNYRVTHNKINFRDDCTEFTPSFSLYLPYLRVGEQLLCRTENLSRPGCPSYFAHSEESI